VGPCALGRARRPVRVVAERAIPRRVEVAVGIDGLCAVAYYGLACRLPFGAWPVMPVTNSFLTVYDIERPEPRYTPEPVLCPARGSAQITQTVPTEKLLTEYAYFSSFSDTIVEHVGALAGRLIETRRLGPSSLVVEIASNDGCLLRHYVAATLPCSGSNLPRMWRVRPPGGGFRRWRNSSASSSPSTPSRRRVRGT
jgi:hypothetical protein